MKELVKPQVPDIDTSKIRESAERRNRDLVWPFIQRVQAGRGIKGLSEKVCSSSVVEKVVIGMREQLLGERFLDLSAELERSGQISDASEMLWDGVLELTTPQILWIISESTLEDAEPVVRENEVWRNRAQFKNILLD